MKSNPPVPTRGSRLRAQNSRTLGSMAAILRGVKTRDRRPAVEVVVRRVLEDDRPGRDLHAALDELEDRSLGRAVGAPVDQGPLDVVEAAQREEVVALVVVERPLVPEPLEHRVRVGVDLEVERVVVQVASSVARHLEALLRAGRGTDVTLEQEDHSHICEGARMRIGVMLGPERGRYSTKVDRLRADVRWAEEAGLASVWIPQIPDDFDALTAAALLGAETSRIEIGTAVVPVQPRHPIALAQQALSVQAVCEGRLALGLGVSHHWVIDEMLGLPYERPLATMRAHLDVLDAALARSRDGRRGERPVPRAQPARHHRHHADPGPARRARPADAAAGRGADRRHHPLDGRREGDRLAHRAHA